VDGPEPTGRSTAPNTHSPAAIHRISPLTNQAGGSGLETHRTASVVIRGHAFVQNLRRGHYELAVDSAPLFGLATAFDELQPAI